MDVKQGHRAGGWQKHDAAWRDPRQVSVLWNGAGDPDPALLQYKVRGAFWQHLEQNRLTLLVTREYEHLVLALSVVRGRPFISHLPLPHPSGIAVDGKRITIASTRSPNMLVELSPATSAARNGLPFLVPRRAHFLPGRLYIHDLAQIGPRLYANAVGMNSIIEIRNGQWKRVWWPRVLDQHGNRAFDRNHLQLNSIAAGRNLESSFFTASIADVGARKPGHRNFPVNGNGVIFSAKSRDVMARGLTRPHSARLHAKKLWVLNSGYGTLDLIRDGSFDTVTQLPGWTRGLAFHKDLAFVGTSRVLPRFTSYAPGLDPETSVCGLHAIDATTGRLLGSLTWPSGNQIFAIEAIPSATAAGFPFSGRASRRQMTDFFYDFQSSEDGDVE